MQEPTRMQVTTPNDNEEFCAVIRDTSMGPVLIAGTAGVICFVHFGEAAEQLKAEQNCRFPDAVSDPGETFLGFVERVVEQIESPNAQPSLPLELDGTPFQCQVWTALQMIPCGQTISYTELANRIGRPSATRAVASACAANSIAVLIPCHRVVRNDGGLGGYRWGLERKMSLLQRELVSVPRYQTAAMDG